MRKFLAFFREAPWSLSILFMLFILGFINPLFFILPIAFAILIYNLYMNGISTIPDYKDIPKVPKTVYPFSTQGPVLQTKYMSDTMKEAYLHSSQWCSIRRSVLIRDQFKCVCCNSTNKLQVHHLTYDRLGSEQTSDLVTLCEPCHQRQHDHYGYDRDTIFYPLIKESTNESNS